MKRLCVELVDPDSVKDLAESLGKPDRIYNFVRDKIEYREEYKDVWSHPTETVRRGYGDCEDKAILLASLLIARGYDAWVRVGRVLVITDPKTGATEETDHAWVLLRNGINWIELDPSCDVCRFGEIAFSIVKLIMDFNNKIIYIHDPEKARNYVIR